MPHGRNPQPNPKNPLFRYPVAVRPFPWSPRTPALSHVRRQRYEPPGVGLIGQCPGHTPYKGNRSQIWRGKGLELRSELRYYRVLRRMPSTSRSVCRPGWTYDPPGRTEYTAFVLVGQHLDSPLNDCRYRTPASITAASGFLVSATGAAQQMLGGFLRSGGRWVPSPPSFAGNAVRCECYTLAGRNLAHPVRPEPVHVP